MKVLTVVGARPQFVKAAALSRAFSRRDVIEEVLVHTGQHFDREMSDIHFQSMEIPRPGYNLGVAGLPHGAMTGRMLERIENVLQRERPDYVVVYGDTNSTVAGALAASKLGITLGHVEAGLRSFNMRMPEEINRILTDRVSNLLFCPTDTAVRNLENEGFRRFPCEIHKCGDVMHDAALHYAPIAAARSRIRSHLGLNEFILCTVHRQENTDDSARLQSIIEALNKLHRDVQVVCPMHPRTRKAIESRRIRAEFTLTPPVGYLDTIELLRHCALVITDSGGIQKEAFFFRKHCVTLREETEWRELVDRGFNMLAGSDVDSILAATASMLTRTSDFDVDLFGGGDAAERIVDRLVEHYGGIGNTRCAS